jgi:hypothetical protein
MMKNALSRFTGISETEIRKRLEKLTIKELKYFKIMLAKSGVLYITSKPGIAKSAIIKSIADKLGFAFYDIRLSMVDETDVGLFPKVGTVTVNGVEWDILKHVPPEWGFLANEKPSIIFFEELNRSQLSVRNAALQILLERSIGFKFHFNDNVLMVASGNLGEEDGTDVEEFDSALNNRLIHVKHLLTIEEWVDGFAREHVHPTIVSFVTTNGEHFYKKSDNEKDNYAYATPRSWTFLSDYINTNFPPVQDTDKNGNLIFVNSKNQIVDEKNPDAMPKMKYAPIKQWLGEIKDIGVSYVGPSITRFIRYCEESMRISIKDVIDRYPDIKNDLKSFNRDKHSELLNSLKEIDIMSLKDVQLENIKEFLTSMSDDEVVGYLLYLLDDQYSLNDDTNNKKNMKVKDFIKDKRFKKFFKTILDHCSKED